jgi:predicted dithiol-disulfide oxidoreductase (DUF899 family)
VSGPKRRPNESREYRAARADPLAAEREALWHLIDLTPAGRGDDPDFPH